MVVRSEKNTGQENHSQGVEPGNNQAALSKHELGQGGVLSIFAWKDFRIDIER